MRNRNGLIDLPKVEPAQLKENLQCIKDGKTIKLNSIDTVLWFLPLVTHALKGGVRTVFEFSEYLSKKHDTTSIFVIYSYSGADFNIDILCESLQQNFPNLKFILRKFRKGIDKEQDLPRSQIALCTLWTTAYLLMRYNKTFRKFYFMQDFEPMFYPGDEVYMTIEQTYRLGFSCIANTTGVGDRFRQYSSDIVCFTPGVDTSIFYPDKQFIAEANPKIFNIVYYGRPENSRNAFFLGIDVLKSLKRKMGNRVSIRSAGADWDPKSFGLSGVIENLGLIKTIEEVASLYRYSHAGLVFMATPHPSYQPLEYMASGCMVATNINEANKWLLNDENSIQCEPLAEVAAEKILSSLVNVECRKKLTENGLKTVTQLKWTDAYRVIEDRLLQ